MLGNTPSARGDVTAQTEETLTRIRQTLAAAGASPADVVDATVYLTSPDAFDAMNVAYRTAFGPEYPARATVVTPLVVDDGLVEIMVTAYLPEG
jgi:enamine deaminase RidA (YjgF/YER057c/UK114 family)